MIISSTNHNKTAMIEALYNIIKYDCYIYQSMRKMMQDNFNFNKRRKKLTQFQA